MPNKKFHRKISIRIYFLLALIIGIFSLLGVTQYPHASSKKVLGVSASILQSTDENIHIGMAYGTQTSDIFGKVDVIWSDGRSSHQNLVTSSYIPFDRDADTKNADGTPRDLTWWKSQHPDWIVYTCDKKTPAFEFGDPNMPLDITNPAVVNYQVTTWIIPTLTGNYPYAIIGIDNVSQANTSKRCGIWRNGVWVQKYTGNYVDPQINNDVVAWAKTMYAKIHSKSATALVSYNYSINTDISNPINSFSQILPYVDFIFDERGFTDYGHSGTNYLTDQNWQNQISAMSKAINQGKGILLNAYEPETNPRVISKQEIQWVLANYLLLKGKYTYTYVSTQPLNDSYFHVFYDRPEYHIQIGHPTNGMYSSQGVYMRNYSNGLVMVNPSSNTTHVVHLSSSYVDSYGQTYNSTIPMAPHSGIILLNARPTASICSRHNGVCIPNGEACDNGFQRKNYTCPLGRQQICCVQVVTTPTPAPKQNNCQMSHGTCMSSRMCNINCNSCNKMGCAGSTVCCL